MSVSTALPECLPEEAGLSPERLSYLDQCLAGFVDQGLYAGVSAMVLRNGRIVRVFAKGFQNRESKLPMTRGTIVRIYSMTKMVVSVAALTLVEEGRLGLLDPVADYLPEFSDPQVMIGGTAQNPLLVPSNKPVTVHHLLTHTSGSVYGMSGESIDELYGNARSELLSAPSLAEYVTRLSRLPLAHHPGTVFAYGYSTDILARVIEVISGMRLDKYLRERILDPLSMRDTDFAVPVDKRMRIAKVYERDATGQLRPHDNLDHEEPLGVRRFPSGGTGLFSTLDDFARFAQMLCDRGKLGELRILGRKTVEHMAANHLVGLENPYHANQPSDVEGFGLGVGVRIQGGLAGSPGTAGAIGWGGAATTLCRVDPAENLVMLCFAQHFPYDEHRLFERFTNTVYQALI